MSDEVRDVVFEAPAGVGPYLGVLYKGNFIASRAQGGALGAALYCDPKKHPELPGGLCLTPLGPGPLVVGDGGRIPLLDLYDIPLFLKFTREDDAELLARLWNAT